MSRSYKVNNQTASIADAVSMAYGEIESLQEECEEVASNMEGTNLASTSKCEGFREAADTLANVSEPDVPDCLATDKVYWHESVPTRRARAPSRAVRLDNALSALREVISLAESLLEGLPENKAMNSDDRDNMIAEVEAFRDSLQETVDEVEGVEFPGFYG